MARGPKPGRQPVEGSARLRTPRRAGGAGVGKGGAAVMARVWGGARTMRSSAEEWTTVGLRVAAAGKEAVPAGQDDKAKANPVEKASSTGELPALRVLL